MLIFSTLQVFVGTYGSLEADDNTQNEESKDSKQM